MPIKINNFFRDHEKAENDVNQPPPGGGGEVLRKDDMEGVHDQCPLVIGVKVDSDPYVQFFLTRFNAIEVHDAIMATTGRGKKGSNGYYK